MTSREGVGDCGFVRLHESWFLDCKISQKVHMAIPSGTGVSIGDLFFHIFGIAETRLGPEVVVKNNLKDEILYNSKTMQRGEPLD